MRTTVNNVSVSTYPAGLPICALIHLFEVQQQTAISFQVGLEVLMVLDRYAAPRCAADTIVVTEKHLTLNGTHIEPTRTVLNSQRTHLCREDDRQVIVHTLAKLRVVLPVLVQTLHSGSHVFAQCESSPETGKSYAYLDHVQQAVLCRVLRQRLRGS